MNPSYIVDQQRASHFKAFLAVHQYLAKGKNNILQDLMAFGIRTIVDNIMIMKSTNVN
jgi:hypothetical protein